MSIWDGKQVGIWQGAFAPLRKHRDYCGNIENHIRIISKSLLDDDERVEEENEDDEDPDRVVVGEGPLQYSVMVGWIGDSTGEYEYVIEAEKEPSDKEAISLIAEYIEEENERRRKANETEITHN